MPVPNRYNGGGPLSGVVQVDPETGAVVNAGWTSTTPQYVTAAQNTPTWPATPIAFTANTPFSIFAADATRHGGRLLNFSATPIYLWPTTNGATPPSGAPSDVIPAAAAGLPGQYEFPFAPTMAITGVSAGAGTGVTGMVPIVW